MEYLSKSELHSPDVRVFNTLRREKILTFRTIHSLITMVKDVLAPIRCQTISNNHAEFFMILKIHGDISITLYYIYCFTAMKETMLGRDWKVDHPSVSLLPAGSFFYTDNAPCEQKLIQFHHKIRTNCIFTTVAYYIDLYLLMLYWSQRYSISKKVYFNLSLTHRHQAILQTTTSNSSFYGESCILIWISPKFVPDGPITNKSWLA